MKNSNFYDLLSVDYDGMINFETNLSKKKEVLKNFISNVKNAADIGCGTGLDSIALFQNNIEVDGFDPSSGMIKKAEMNSDKFNAQIAFYNLSIDEISNTFNKKYDLVISLGNAIPNIHPDKLSIGFQRISQMLKPEGKFVLEILNYNKILAKKEKIVNIKEHKGKWFVRYYDFHEKEIHFNILSFSKDNPAEREVITTVIYPYDIDQLSEMLYKANFTKINLFGGLNKTEFIPSESNNLIIEAFINGAK